MLSTTRTWAGAQTNALLTTTEQGQVLSFGCNKPKGTVWGTQRRFSHFIAKKKGANIPTTLGGKGDEAPTTWQQHGEAVIFSLETGQ